MSFGKRLVGALAGLAALAAGLVGVQAANAVSPDPQLTLDSLPGTSLLASDWKAYQLVGYDLSRSELNSARTAYENVAPSSVSSDVENAIANALHASGVTVSSNPSWTTGGSNSTAEADLLGLTGSTLKQNKLVAVARQLAQHASSLGTAHPATAVAGNDHRLVFNGLPDGLYLVVDSNSDHAAAAQPVIVSTKVNGKGLTGQSDLGVAHVKNSGESTPVKHYTNAAGVGSVSSEPAVAQGDTATFYVEVTLPNKNAYKKFVFTDNAHGYAINHDVTVQVKNAHGDWEDVPSAYQPTVTYTPDTPAAGPAYDASSKNASFTFTDYLFNQPEPTDNTTEPVEDTAHSLLSQYSNTRIRVKYTAVVKDFRASNIAQTRLTDRSGHEHPVTPGNPVFNGGDPTSAPGAGKIVKVDAGNTSTKLAGAKFTLKDVTPLPGTHVDHDNGYMLRGSHTGTSVTGAYEWSHTSDAAAATLTSGDGTSAPLGEIDLNGLGEGEYTLTETAAPAGYLNNSAFFVTVRVTVDHTGKMTARADTTLNAGLLEATDGGVGTAGATAVYDVTPGSPTVGQITTPAVEPTLGSQAVLTVKNMSNISQLPATGGAGVIAGVILVALLALIGWGSVEVGRRLRARQRQ